MDTTTSQRVEACLERWRGGDAAARDELIGHVLGRYTGLARKMLRDYPGLKASGVETGDVAQDAYLRLHRALEQIPPRTAHDFFGLAALQIRRVLLDLLRKRKGRGPDPRPGVVTLEGADSAPVIDPSTSTLDPAALAIWTEFHETVDRLPPDEREAVDLHFYQGLTHEETAALLGVDSSTAKRRWLRAIDKLGALLDGVHLE